MSDNSREAYKTTTIYVGSDEDRAVVEAARHIIAERGWPRSFSEWVRLQCEELVAEATQEK